MIVVFCFTNLLIGAKVAQPKLPELNFSTNGDLKSTIGLKSLLLQLIGPFVLLVECDPEGV
jgi:hypothetical protein